MDQKRLEKLLGLVPGQYTPADAYARIESLLRAESERMTNMDAYDVLHGPVTPDSYRIREHYRIEQNIAAMRQDAEEEDLRAENKRLKAENEALKCSSNRNDQARGSRTKEA